MRRKPDHVLYILQAWKAWAQERNEDAEAFQDETIPEELTSTLTPQKFNDLLCFFIFEVRRKTDGKPYPGNTLHQIISLFNTYYRDVLGINLRILDENNTTFHKARQCLDARMKELQSKGFGLKIKSADDVSPAEEKTLWDTGVLNTETAAGTSNILFLYNCTAFGLRGFKEHKDLLTSNFEIKYCIQQKKHYILYSEGLTKTYRGGLKSKNYSPRTVSHYSDPSNPRDLFPIYQDYLSKLPPNSHFYVKPLPNTANGEKRWSADKIGDNDIKVWMHQIFDLAGLEYKDRNIVNHSGRSTCATKLFREKFSEKAVMSRTGHRSNAVRRYQKVDTELEDQMSQVLNPPPPTGPAAAPRRSASTPRTTCTATAPSTSPNRMSNVSAAGPLPGASLPLIHHGVSLFPSTATDEEDLQAGMTVIKLPYGTKAISIQVSKDQKYRVYFDYNA